MLQTVLTVMNNSVTIFSEKTGLIDFWSTSFYEHDIFSLAFILPCMHCYSAGLGVMDC